MVTRSIADQTPPPRFDKTSWTEAKVEEAREGDESSWTVVSTQVLEADTDPATPAPRSFTFEVEGQDPVDLFRITWLDKAGNTYTGPVMRYTPLPVWAPSVDDVAPYLRARLKTRAGATATTFTSETAIPRAQAEAMLPRAVRRIASEIGVAPCTTELGEDAGTCAAMFCAMLLEQTFFPDQTQNSGSSFKSLQSEFEPAMKALCDAVYSQCGTVAGGPGVLPVANGGDGQGLISRDNPEAW